MSIWYFASKRKPNQSCNVAVILDAHHMPDFKDNQSTTNGRATKGTNPYYAHKMDRKPKMGCVNEEGPEFKKPLDPKRVLQILECKRRILNFVESMLEPEVTIDELRSGEELLCKSDYDSIVQERYILKLCGYPLCSNKVTREWKQRYHISLKQKRIYDVEVRKLFCSVGCMDTSNKYKDDHLPEQPIWVRLEDMRMCPSSVVKEPNVIEKRTQGTNFEFRGA